MNSKGKKNSQKGSRTEELLASYFRKSGYFVVRGVPFNYMGYSVTDIDLWLYLRSSSVSREIAIVDIKKKRTPQAIERIFWTKGLQTAIDANKAIVATKDSREEVMMFGKKLGVTVLGGRFLNKLEKLDSTKEERLSEEELQHIVNNSTFGKIDGDWKGRLLQSKEQLSGGLSFDSINYWLEQGRFFAEQVIARPTNRELALRVLFRIIAFFTIGIDYVLKDLSFKEHSEKELALKSGFTYGNEGRSIIEDKINQSMKLLQQFGGISSSEAGTIKSQVDKAFLTLPTGILGEFFANVNVARSLVDIARELDFASMSIAGPLSYNYSQLTRGLIGCLLDFWGIGRNQFGLGELQSNTITVDLRSRLAD